MIKMKRIDRVFKELSSLFELNKIINTYKIRGDNINLDYS